ncbi:MAG TPA: DUF4136 domain-containing protein [Chthoniobacteraceae bacterium]|nr:DUF4136 domain-containing protein [Chthoniobacteraceae bacterium]
MMRSFFALAATLLLFAGCASTRHRTTQELLTPPKTFQFLPDKAILAAEEAAVSNAVYWHTEVEKAIAYQLVLKGFSEQTTGSTDVLVAFHVILQRGEQTTFLDNYSGYSLSAKEQAEQADIEKYLTAPGTKNRSILIVDVIDPVKQQVVWREWTQAPTRTGVSTAQRERAIQKAVRKIFSDFPPQA